MHFARRKHLFFLQEYYMQLRVNRFKNTEKSTLGRLFINATTECYTLEDVVRPDGVKVDGQTAIPAGTYNVIIDSSTRFKRDMPHILDVPGFTGIRIHSGNTDADTEGCILLGTKIDSDDFISGSHDAFNSFFSKLKAALDSGEGVSILIHNG
jgi:hypothetical protein